MADEKSLLHALLNIALNAYSERNTMEDERDKAIEERNQLQEDLNGKSKSKIATTLTLYKDLYSHFQKVSNDLRARAREAAKAFGYSEYSSYFHAGQQDIMYKVLNDLETYINNLEA